MPRFIYLFITEMLLKIKEEELNLIIIEMRKNCTSLQEKLIKEEAEKSVRNILKSFLPFKFWKKKNESKCQS